MKISNKKKAENREKIIQMAVDLISRKGLKSASMREIARKAGVGEATIYNYFPTKESIIFAYYQDRMESGVTALEEIRGFEEYTFQEKLQALFDGLLEQYLPDREFVSTTYDSVFFSLSQNFRQLKPIRSLFIEKVRNIFKTAEESGEIEHQAFADMLYQFFWDYLIVLVMYWLKDDSRGFSRTAVLLDKSLGLGCAMLKAGVANKISDIALFLFKNHVLNRMEFFEAGTDLFRKVHGEKNSEA